MRRETPPCHANHELVVGQLEDGRQVVGCDALDPVEAAPQEILEVVVPPRQGDELREVSREVLDVRGRRWGRGHGR